MPTKDPHIAVIDAQEELHLIKTQLSAAIAHVKARAARGQPLTEDDRHIIKLISQRAIDATNFVQDRLARELNL